MCVLLQWLVVKYIFKLCKLVNLWYVQIQQVHQALFTNILILSYHNILLSTCNRKNPLSCSWNCLCVYILFCIHQSRKLWWLDIFLLLLSLQAAYFSNVKNTTLQSACTDVQFKIPNSWSLSSSTYVITFADFLCTSTLCSHSMWNAPSLV